MTTKWNNKGELVVVEIENLIDIFHKYFPNVEVGYADAGKMLASLKKVDLSFDEVVQFETIRKCVNEDMILMMESAKDGGGVEYVRGNSHVTVCGVDGVVILNEKVSEVVVLKHTKVLDVTVGFIDMLIKVPHGTTIDNIVCNNEITVNTIDNESLLIKHNSDQTIEFDLGIVEDEDVKVHNADDNNVNQEKDEDMENKEDVVEEPSKLNDTPKAKAKAAKAEAKAQKKLLKKKMGMGKKILIGTLGVVAVAGIGYAVIKLKK